MPFLSHARRWRGQIARRDRTREILPLVRAVAERRIPRMAAAAKRDRGSAAQPKFVVFLIDNLKIAFDAKWAIAEDGDFGSCHECLRKF
jgi:hypothetical protein